MVTHLLSQHKMITSSVAEADWKLQDFYKFPTEEKYILLFPMEKSFALNLTILHKMFKSCLWMKSGHDSSLNDACHISPSPPEPGRCGPRRSSLEPFIFQLPFVRDIGAGPRTADCHPHQGGRASNKPSRIFRNHEEGLYRALILVENSY